MPMAILYGSINRRHNLKKDVFIISQNSILLCQNYNHF